MWFQGLGGEGGIHVYYAIYNESHSQGENTVYTCRLHAQLMYMQYTLIACMNSGQSTY